MGQAQEQQQKVTFILSGLDKAGKTTLLSTLKAGYDESHKTQDNVRMDFYSLGAKTTLLSYDASQGQNVQFLQPLLPSNIILVMWIIDSASTLEQQQQSKTCLQNLLQILDPSMPVLLLANKQDLPLAAPVHEMIQAMWNLQLEHVLIRPIVALNGEGMVKALEEAQQMVKELNASK